MTHVTEVKPLRADARRNREKILVAARDAFTEQGAACSLDDVAKRAGVGPGTLYRHFATREDLLQEVLGDWVEHITLDAERFAARDDLAPEDLLLEWFEALLRHVIIYQGASVAMLKAMDDPENPLYGSCRALGLANEQVIASVAGRGAVRDDVDALEIGRLVTGVANVVDAVGIRADEARPMLRIVRDGVLRTR